MLKKIKKLITKYKKNKANREHMERVCQSLDIQANHNK